MGSKSKNMSNNNNKQPKVEGQSGDSGAKMYSESDVTTPQTSDLSDSAFNYDVERNWSVIFTDDNYSTDHDIRSNYSSSSEASEMDPTHSVISETESEGGALPSTTPSNKRRDTASTLKAVQEEAAADSVSTLKEGPIPIDGSFSFPDPIKNDVKKEDEAIEKHKVNMGENSKEKPDGSSFQSFVDSHMHHLSYGIIVLVSLDILVQVLNGSSILGGLSGSLSDYSRKPYEEGLNTLTIIRYSTKTETHYLPGQTITVENTVPYETVIPKEEYQHHDQLVGRLSSWELTSELFQNFREDTGEAYVSMSMKAANLWERASKNAYNIARQVKAYNYSDSANALRDKSNQLVDKTPGALEEFKDKLISFTRKIQDDQSVQATIHSFNNKLSSFQNFSKRTFDNLNSGGYFDYFKEDKLEQMSHYLNESKNFIFRTGSVTLSLFKTTYADFTKNGPLDDLQESFHVGYDYLKARFNLSSGAANGLLSKYLHDANGSVNVLKDKGFKLWDSVDGERKKNTLKTSLEKASKNSKERWDQFKQSYLDLDDQELGERANKLSNFFSSSQKKIAKKLSHNGDSKSKKCGVWKHCFAGL